MVQAILRLYSYALQLVISLILLALGLVAALSANSSFDLDFLPWSGKDLRMALLLLGSFGLLSLLLAIKGKLRFLFVLWTLGTTYLMGRGIFVSPYRFEGESHFKWALFLLLAIFVTIFGAWSRFRQPLGR